MKKIFFLTFLSLLVLWLNNISSELNAQKKSFPITGVYRVNSFSEMGVQYKIDAKITIDEDKMLWGGYLKIGNGEPLYLRGIVKRDEVKYKIPTLFDDSESIEWGIVYGSELLFKKSPDAKYRVIRMDKFKK